MKADWKAPPRVGVAATIKVSGGIRLLNPQPRTIDSSTAAQTAIPERSAICTRKGSSFPKRMAPHAGAAPGAWTRADSDASWRRDPSSE